MENLSPSFDKLNNNERAFYYQKTSKYLGGLTEKEIGDLLDNAHVLGQGVGGACLSLNIDGKVVFVKKIPITKTEKKNPNSTINLFNLPTYYQYNLGSTRFGIWRELKIRQKTSEWVLNGNCPNFPLLYHSRVQEKGDETESDQEYQVQTEKVLKHWGNCVAIHERTAQLSNSSTEMVLFLEYVPKTLHQWIKDELPKQTEEVNTSFLQMVEELFAVVQFMKEHEVLHFDTHFHNILTDGEHVYFSDFGLASALEFDLSKDERSFFQKHKDYDHHYVSAEIAMRVLSALKGKQACKDLVYEYKKTGRFNAAIPPELEELVKKCLPSAAILYSFREDLIKNKKAPYPF